MFRFLFALLLLFPALAHAQTAVDMTQQILDEHKKPVVNLWERTDEDPDCKKCGYLTLGYAIHRALIDQYKEEDHTLTGEQR